MNLRPPLLPGDARPISRFLAPNEVRLLKETVDFRRQMHKEHRTLRLLQEDLVDRFETFCENPLPRHAEAFQQVLQDFSRSLERHFDFEEEGGYLQVVVKRRPHHAIRVEELRLEHKELRDELARLRDLIRQNLAEHEHLMQDFKRDFVALIRTFGRHEQAERELVMDVYWLEGGVSD